MFNHEFNEDSDMFFQNVELPPQPQTPRETFLAKLELEIESAAFHHGAVLKSCAGIVTHDVQKQLSYWGLRYHKATKDWEYITKRTHPSREDGYEPYM